MPNIFYKFAHLQLFNIKHKIVHLQVVRRQIFFLRKSCLSQTEENCCLWTYGRASLVSDFNSSGKMRTCYLWDIYKFFLRYCALRKSVLKCGFPTNGIKLTRFVLFEAIGVPQLSSALRYLGLGHFGKYRMKICEIQVRLWNKKF